MVGYGMLYKNAVFENLTVNSLIVLAFSHLAHYDHICDHSEPIFSTGYWMNFLFRASKIWSIKSGSGILHAGATLLSKFNMSVCSLATCYWFIDWRNEKTNNWLATIIAFNPPAPALSVHLPHFNETCDTSVCTGAGGWSLFIYCL